MSVISNVTTKAGTKVLKQVRGGEIEKHIYYPKGSKMDSYGIAKISRFKAPCNEGDMVVVYGGPRMGTVLSGVTEPHSMSEKTITEKLREYIANAKKALSDN